MTVHMLPIGKGTTRRTSVLTQSLRYRDTRRVRERMAKAHDTSAA